MGEKLIFEKIFKKLGIKIQKNGLLYELLKRAESFVLGSFSVLDYPIIQFAQNKYRQGLNWDET